MYFMTLPAWVNKTATHKHTYSSISAKCHNLIHMILNHRQTLNLLAGMLNRPARQIETKLSRLALGLRSVLIFCLNTIYSVLSPLEITHNCFNWPINETGLVFLTFILSVGGININMESPSSHFRRFPIVLSPFWMLML